MRRGLLLACKLALVGLAVPLAAQDRRMAASIGKSFVAATVLALEDEGRLLWSHAVQVAGGGYAWTSADLARWGDLLFGGEALEGPCMNRLLDGLPVDPDAPGILYGTGVAIYADTPRGPVWGHGGWIPAHGSSPRHDPVHGVTVAFRINTDIGVTDDSSDLVPAPEVALADPAIEAVR